MSNNIVKTVFNNHSITTIKYKDEFLWKVQEVAGALEYKDLKHVSKKILSGDWSKEFDANKEYILFKGGEFNIIKKLLEEEGESPSSHANQLLLLKEPGLYAFIGKSKKQEAVEFRKHLNREILPKLVRGQAVVADGTAVTHKPNGLDIRKLELEEKREDRLLMQAKMEERNQKANAIEDAMEFLREAGHVDTDVFAAYKVTATEIRTGIDLTHMRPALKGGEWKTPTDISEETGFTLRKIGGAISSIGRLRGNPKYSKTSLWTDPKNGRLHKCYMYNEEAVELIMNELYGGQMPLV